MISAGVFLSQDGGQTFDPLALTNELGQVFDGTGSPMDPIVFAAVKDPVINALSDSVAFMAQIKGPGVSAARNSGIWWTAPMGPTPALVAQTGTATLLADGTTSRTFQAFAALALPAPGIWGCSLVATMAGNISGLYSIDSGTGLITELLRTGQTVAVVANGVSQERTLSGFDVIGVNTASSTPGVTRSFSDAGSTIAYRATFAGKGAPQQAVMTLYLPPKQ